MEFRPNFEEFASAVHHTHRVLKCEKFVWKKFKGDFWRSWACQMIRSVRGKSLRPIAHDFASVGFDNYFERYANTRYSNYTLVLKHFTSFVGYTPRGIKSENFVLKKNKGDFWRS